jgi:repressor LexA
MLIEIPDGGRMSETSGPSDFVPYLELSERQQEILQFLWSWPLPYSPSLREIGDAVGLNGPSAVRYQLDELVDKGWVLRHSKRPRALEVRGSDGRFPVRPVLPRTGYLRLPELGLVPAGKPKEALQVYENGWDLPVELVGNGELFLLRVHGDSMVDAAIVDGDWVAVRKQQDAENGEIVVAMIDGDVTVKSLRRTADGRVSLVAQNPAYPAIPAERAKIRGKVVAVLRRT